MRLRARHVRAGVAAVLTAGLLALAGSPAQGVASAARLVATPAPAAPSTEDLPVSVAVTAVAPQVLTPGQDLTVTATLRNDGDEVVEQPRASVRIYRYRISSRDELDTWARSGASSPIGDVAATTALEGDLAPGATATVTVTVPGTSIGLSRTDDAWGPRGLTLDVGSAAGRVGVDRTFLLWASADEVPTAQVGVLSSVVGPATDPAAAAATEAEAGTGQEPAPTPTPTASAAGEDDATAEEPGESDARLTTLTASGGRLSRLLQATGAFPFVTWAVDPALVDQAATGSRAAQSWLTALTEGAADREVLRLPWADPDLSAIAHADGPTDLLALARDVPSSAGEALWQDADPVLWAADDVPDLVTATRAAASAPGTPLVVGPDALAAEDSETPSAPAAVQTASGTVTALVPDATLTELLSDPAASQPGVTAATAAQRVLAETAVLARSDDAGTTYVLAATPRDWEPTAAIAQAQLTALRDAPWVDTASVADVLAADADGQADGDGAQRAALPQTDRSAQELTPAWVNALSAEWRSAGEFAAVVDDPSALLAGLPGDLVAPLAVAWRDDPDGRGAAVNDALAEAKARQSGLSVLLNEQFTVISSSAPVRVAVRNELDQAANVRVELRPQKGCLDTTRSELTSVDPDAETTVELTLRATANCDVTVDVSLVSASGREVATPVTFSARVAPTIESVGAIVVGVLLALALGFGIWRTIRRGQTAKRGARVAADAAAAGTTATPPPGRQDQP
ncbi:DUF6049 family protein [Cellulomonas sp. Marseille-Q8402]